MTFRLLYHNVDSPGAISPFDEALVSIATGDDVRLACPYISLSYLERLTKLSTSWRLLTDVEEWLRSHNRTQRERILLFLVRFRARIRHCPRLHAKVAVGSRSAMLGSANFTDLGIKWRTEMCMMVEEEPQVRQLTEWFETHWSKGYEVRRTEIDEYLKTLPEDAVTQHGNDPVLFHPSRSKPARLVDVPGSEAKYWCLNFDFSEVLEHGLTNQMWMMQYQYGHNGKTNQGNKIRAITSNWKAAARIKPGDWCVAYLKRNKFFAIGQVIAPRRSATHQDTLKRTLGGRARERHHLYYDGIVYYTDAAGALYEDHTDRWRLAPEEYPYAQRIDVREWQYARQGENGAFVARELPGLLEAAPTSNAFIQNAAFEMGEAFFRRVKAALSAD